MFVCVGVVAEPYRLVLLKKLDDDVAKRAHAAFAGEINIIAVSNAPTPSSYHRHHTLAVPSIDWDTRFRAWEAAWPELFAEFVTPDVEVVVNDLLTGQIPSKMDESTKSDHMARYQRMRSAGVTHSSAPMYR